MVTEYGGVLYDDTGREISTSADFTPTPQPAALAPDYLSKGPSSVTPIITAPAVPTLAQSSAEAVATNENLIIDINDTLVGDDEPVVSRSAESLEKVSHTPFGTKAEPEVSPQGVTKALRPESIEATAPVPPAPVPPASLAVASDETTTRTNTSAFVPGSTSDSRVAKERTVQQFVNSSKYTGGDITPDLVKTIVDENPTAANYLTTWMTGGESGGELTDDMFQKAAAELTLQVKPQYVQRVNTKDLDPESAWRSAIAGSSLGSTTYLDFVIKSNDPAIVAAKDELFSNLTSRNMAVDQETGMLSTQQLAYYGSQRNAAISAASAKIDAALSSLQTRATQSVINYMGQKGTPESEDDFKKGYDAYANYDKTTAALRASNPLYKQLEDDAVESAYLASLDTNKAVEKAKDYGSKVLVTPSMVAGGAELEQQYQDELNRIADSNVSSSEAARQIQAAKNEFRTAVETKRQLSWTDNFFWSENTFTGETKLQTANIVTSLGIFTTLWETLYAQQKRTKEARDFALYLNELEHQQAMEMQELRNEGSVATAEAGNDDNKGVSPTTSLAKPSLGQ